MRFFWLLHSSTLYLYITLQKVIVCNLFSGTHKRSKPALRILILQPHLLQKRDFGPGRIFFCMWYRNKLVIWENVLICSQILYWNWISFSNWTYQRSNGNDNSRYAFSIIDHVDVSCTEVVRIVILTIFLHAAYMYPNTLPFPDCAEGPCEYPLVWITRTPLFWWLLLVGFLQSHL